MELFLSDMTNLTHSSLRTCLVVAQVKAALHVRVNFREFYREYIATMLKHESKSWRVGSLQCSENTGPARPLRVRSFRLYVRVNIC